MRATRSLRLSTIWAERKTDGEDGGSPTRSRLGDHLTDGTLRRPRGCLVHSTGVRSRQQNLIKGRREESCDAVGTRREDGHQCSG